MVDLFRSFRHRRETPCGDVRGGRAAAHRAMRRSAAASTVRELTPHRLRPRLHPPHPQPPPLRRATGATWRRQSHTTRIFPTCHTPFSPYVIVTYITRRTQDDTSHTAPHSHCPTCRTSHSFVYMSDAFVYFCFAAQARRQRCRSLCLRKIRRG